MKLFLLLPLFALLQGGCASAPEIGKTTCECGSERQCPQGFGCQRKAAAWARNPQDGGNTCYCIKLPEFKPMQVPEKK